MIILINLIVGIILSTTDLYIINYYMCLKNKFKRDKTYQQRIIFITSFILLLFINYPTIANIMKLILIILVAYLIGLLYNSSHIQNIKNSIIYLFINLIIHVIISCIFSWIFNITFNTTYINYFISYTLLINCIKRYVLFIGLSVFNEKSYATHMSKLLHFKLISICLFTYFAITIAINNKALFYFPDVGRTFVFVIFISIASLIFFDRYQVKHEKIERDLIITTQNITKEKEYLKKYNDSADEIRKMRHNMHNDLNIIYGYLNSNEFDDAMKHVCHLLGDMNKTSAIIHVGHTSIDSIIDDKIKVMAAKDITYTEEIVSVNIGNIDVNTIAILVGLALDNAIEAAEKVDSGREVKLEIMNRKNYLVLHIENSIIPGSHPTFNKTSKLTDPMNHGYGVKQINHIAKQYNGNAKFEVNHNFVTLKIILDMRLNEDPSL